ncbi:MAG: hypothetical protein JXQ87_19515 [Bacteroidia bacterium]
MRFFIPIIFIFSFVGQSHAKNLNADSLKNVIHGNFHDTAKAKAYNELGIVLKRKGLIDSSMVVYDQGINLAHKINAQKTLAILYTNQGFAFYDKREIDTCEALIKKSIDIYKRLKINK